MSHVPAPPRTRRTVSPARGAGSRPSTGAGSGLPTWSGIAILLAALATGLLLSLASGSVGWAYLLCFVAAGIAVTLFTELRGLFLIVASLPLLFGILTPLTSWLVNQASSAGTTSFSVTSVLTAVFPLLQYFPVLICVSLGAAIIAGLRLWLNARRIRARELAARRARRRDAEAERINRDAATRARRQSTMTRPRRSERTGERVTVEELMQRNPRANPRSASDDLYSG